MQPFKYKPPRVNSGELRIPVTFFEYVPNDGPEPGEQKEEPLYDCLAKIDVVWLKDLELAKSNGTLSDLTLTIRDPHGSYIPTNKHYLSVDSPYYEGEYNVKHVQPDPQDGRFINIMAEVSSA